MSNTAEEKTFGADQSVLLVALLSVLSLVSYFVIFHFGLVMTRGGMGNLMYLLIIPGYLLTINIFHVLCMALAASIRRATWLSVVLIIVGEIACLMSM